MYTIMFCLDPVAGSIIPFIRQSLWTNLGVFLCIFHVSAPLQCCPFSIALDMLHCACDITHVALRMWHDGCFMTHMARHMWYCACGMTDVACHMWHDTWHDACDMMHEAWQMWHDACGMMNACDITQVTWGRQYVTFGAVLRKNFKIKSIVPRLQPFFPNSIRCQAGWLHGMLHHIAPYRIHPDKFLWSCSAIKQSCCLLI